MFDPSVNPGLDYCCEHILGEEDLGTYSFISTCSWTVTPLSSRNSGSSRETFLNALSSRRSCALAVRSARLTIGFSAKRMFCRSSISAAVGWSLHTRSYMWLSFAARAESWRREGSFRALWRSYLLSCRRWMAAWRRAPALSRICGFIGECDFRRRAHYESLSQHHDSRGVIT